MAATGQIQIVAVIEPVGLWDLFAIAALVGSHENRHIGESVAEYVARVANDLMALRPKPREAGPDLRPPPEPIDPRDQGPF